MGVDTAGLHGFLIDAKDMRGFDDRTAETLGANKNHFAGFRALLGENEGNAVFQDSGFFAGDFLEGMAEEVFVVEINTRDDGDEW